MSNPVKPAHLSDEVACLKELVIELAHHENMRLRRESKDAELARLLSRTAAVRGATDTGWYDTVGAPEEEAPPHEDSDNG